MKRKYPVLVLSFIFISTALLFQNCSQPSSNDYPAASTTNAADSGNSASGGVNVDSSGNSSPSDSSGPVWGGGTSTNSTSSTTPASSTNTTSTTSFSGEVTAASSTELKVKITFGAEHVGVFGAIYVAAYFNNVWYFWDATQAPQARWVATDMNAATYPEFVSGNAPASGEITITEMVAEAHGAKIYVGAGFGGDAATRRNELVNTQRHKLIYTIP